MRAVCVSRAALAPHLFDDDLPVLMDGAVVNHAHYGHAQVTPNAEGDAETQAAQHGDDVAPRQTEAGAVEHRSLLLRSLFRPTILRQLDHLPSLLFPLHHPAEVSRALSIPVHIRRPPLNNNS